MAMTTIAYNVVSAARLFLKAFRCSTVEFANICDMIALYVLRVPVLFHNVAIPISIVPLCLSIIIESQHSIIFLLMSDHVIKRRLSPLVTWRYLSLRTHMLLYPLRIFTCPCTLLMVRVVILLSHRIEAVPRGILVNSLEEGHPAVTIGLGLMLLLVSVGHYVEVLHFIRRH